MRLVFDYQPHFYFGKNEFLIYLIRSNKKAQP